MYHVSAHGVAERMINVHYYYYLIMLKVFSSASCFYQVFLLPGVLWNRVWDQESVWQLLLEFLLVVADGNSTDFACVSFRQMVG